MTLFITGQIVWCASNPGISDVTPCYFLFCSGVDNNHQPVGRRLKPLTKYGFKNALDS